MSNQQNVGYFSESEQRIIKVLGRLAPHIVANDFTLTGGFALRYHLATHQILLPQKPFNDLDVVVKDITFVRPTITQDFLIAHYHAEKHADTAFFVQVIDPVSKSRIDIYPQSTLGATIHIDIAKCSLQIVTAEELLVSTLAFVLYLAQKQRIPPKHFQTIRRLLSIVDLNKSEQIWDKDKQAYHVHTMQDAVKRVTAIEQQHPQWIQEVVYAADETIVCRKCCQHPEFPLAHAKEISDVLGYV